MKTSKKMLSLLLIAAMLVSVLCMGVSATGTYDEVSIAPTLKSGRTTYTLNAQRKTTLAAKTYTLTSSADHVFVNGVEVSAASGYSITLTAGMKVQIIAQTGTESPFITVLSCD